MSIDLSQGGRMLNSGDTKGALRFFENLRESFNPVGNAEVEQMYGICQRMLGNYDEAEAAFESAYRLARTRIHKGRIQRDWCMVPLVQGDTGRAMKFIEGSLALLKYDDNTPDPEDGRPFFQQEAERKIEYFTSLGFRCRIDAKNGNISRARVGYKMTRQMLRDVRPYELNSLAWELKFVPFGLRYELFPRAFKLAWKDRNWKRSAQVFLLTFCRPIGLLFKN
ncbi:MAG TPA: tetratricopeptide repeat protein [Candidatus Saccharimonadales bacterium]|nr:tetratricopeptide repeat protein [Candidatus Saccharimonadales bacterium]